MNIEEVKKLCTEKLQGICSSCTIEEMKHLVNTEDMNEASHEYVLCHVTDKAKALCSLWGNLNGGKPQMQVLKLPIMCLSAKDNTFQIIRDVITEVLGFPMPSLEFIESNTYESNNFCRNIYNISKIIEKSNTYLYDGGNNIDDEKVKECILSKGIKIVIKD